MKNIEPQIDIGPFAHENWLAFLAGKPSSGAEEFVLFTDAYVTGELSTGCDPYQLLNMVPAFVRDNLKPAISLRVNFHFEQGAGADMMSETDVDRYHAGYIHDEIAAILSLSMGIRLKSGGMTRRFDTMGDSRGRPVAYDRRPDPGLTVGLEAAPILPEALGRHDLESSNPLLTLPRTTPTVARVLVKSARLYQDAVWLVESETSLAWVLLISAVETAASEWRKEKSPPVDRLQQFRPRLVTILREYGGDGLVADVATMIADYMGATKTFVDFLIEHLPEAPPNRPATSAQIEWNDATLRTIFGKVYDWRSKALHGGVPFPLPMCQPPHLSEGRYSEKPFALAMAARGGVWTIDDTPILFHTFEYIARNAILAWWTSSLAEKPAR